MKVVVTGAAGLLGRHVMADLGAHGHVTVGLDRTALPAAAGSSIVVDLFTTAQLDQLLEGADGIIHLARIPFPYAASGYDAKGRTWRKPDLLGDAQRFSANVTMTNNVLAVAAGRGIRRIVMGSSFAVYGFYYPSRPLLPTYIPVYECHPRAPDDPYGLTKLIGEDLADAYVTRLPAQVASLRFPGVSPPDHGGFPAKRRDPMARGTAGLWTYIDVRDAATACRLALEHDLEGHQAFNICAPVTFMRDGTRALLRKYLPEVVDIRGPEDGNWAGYDTTKAQRILGFKAGHLVILDEGA